MHLTGFKILTFDVYGTLIDWEAGMAEGLRPLTDRLPEAVPRDRVLETHAFHESRQQALTPARCQRWFSASTRWPISPPRIRRR
ncbi:hypothetical protein [Pseudodonghicola flavimaris]|uniref:Haloacid dehalogenase n=1 Tax=Pseudodonghicola flavimaris TaxID=3050036 RepID=A0ABT7F2I4_9RHOB|nr:hypothetical protein [Pseudodonghicola flavimaris]MDK3018811.1 hypothetical protein [Pseudodonghicola flavimaris]